MDNFCNQNSYPTKSKMAAAAIWNQLSFNNSTIFERIWTKLDTGTENKVPGQLFPPELISNKIQDGGGRHIENHVFGHNLAIIASICTEFET